jgi:hypothetical protein
VNTIEELLGSTSSGSGLEIREYGRKDTWRWPRGILYPQKLTLTSPTSGGRSDDIVCSRTQVKEFFSVISKQEVTTKQQHGGSGKQGSIFLCSEDNKTGQFRHYSD